MRYKRSLDHLARAEKVIPLGAQTFSKSKLQFPPGAAPLYIERGKANKVWDIDGNEYIDFINGLASINLGYCDPEVNAAVEKQLAKGTIFSLPQELECEVAELIVKMVPCAEMVRFGKNGSDATTAAIRLARAVTGREKVAVCGYHGWQDWYIGSTSRSLGVPQVVKNLTHKFCFNDIESLLELLDHHKNEFAAVILEPVNAVEPQDGFLEAVRTVTKNNDVILIFDETISGFRVSNGGAQEYYGVTPDLATFGKAMANGLPISAVTGRAEIMEKMEEIFFSTTFGGELLSLAAAKAVLKKLVKFPVIDTINERGCILKSELIKIIDRAGVGKIFSVSGLPCWSFLKIHSNTRKAQEIRTYIIQELCENGILSIGSHNISYANTDSDIKELTRAYENIFEKIGLVNESGKWEQILKVKPLVPIFEIR